MKKLDESSRAAGRVALFYAFFSTLWILCSDQAVYFFFDDPALITFVQSAKGWAFVLLSAAIIFVLMWREIRRIHAAESALNDQKSLLNAVLENSPAIVYLKDTEGRYIYVNNRFCELVHTDRTEILGKTDPEVFPPSQAGEYQRNDREVLDSKTTQSFYEPVHLSDGIDRTNMSVKFPLHDGEGKIYGLCGISTDVTERMELEEKLRRTERLNALGRLTGGIAHDFNNHLTVVIGCLQMLQGSGVEDEERVSLAREASRASFQAATLIDRLLSFARNQILITQEVDINKTIREMDSLLSRSLGSGVTVRYALMREGACAVLDPAQLESAILNLAINARDAMGGDGTLTIGTLHEIIGQQEAASEEIAPGPYVRLDVSDTGAGMSEEVLARVREPFFTTKGPGKGTGLGLSMVDGFARQSRGCIRIASAPGNGTTISILVPAIEASECAEPAALPVPDAVEAAGPPAHVLVVEDEPALLAFSTRVLESKGYRVSQASNAEDAQRLIDGDGGFDLLLSDVMLPGGALGPELARRFHGRYPAAAVLLMSGYADPGLWPDMPGLPRPQILKKPYGKDELLQAVQRVIQLAGSARH